MIKMMCDFCGKEVDRSSALEEVKPRMWRGMHSEEQFTMHDLFPEREGHHVCGDCNCLRYEAKGELREQIEKLYREFIERKLKEKGQWE